MLLAAPDVALFTAHTDASRPIPPLKSSYSNCLLLSLAHNESERHIVHVHHHGSKDPSDTSNQISTRHVYPVFIAIATVHISKASLCLPRLHLLLVLCRQHQARGSSSSARH